MGANAHCHPELAKDLYHPGSAVLERERWVLRPQSEAEGRRQKAEGRKIKPLAPLQCRTPGMIKILRKLRMTAKLITRAHQFLPSVAPRFTRRTLLRMTGDKRAAVPGACLSIPLSGRKRLRPAPNEKRDLVEIPSS